MICDVDIHSALYMAIIKILKMDDDKRIFLKCNVIARMNSMLCYKGLQ